MSSNIRPAPDNMGHLLCEFFRQFYEPDYHAPPWDGIRAESFKSGSYGRSVSQQAHRERRLRKYGVIKGDREGA